MARKFIVVSGLEAEDIQKCFSVSGKAPRADVCPRFSSFNEALEDAFDWADSGYCAAVLRPIRGGGWVEVASVEIDWTLHNVPWPTPGRGAEFSTATR